MYAELTKYYGPNMGIRVYGELDSFGFHRQYYFPFLEGALDTTEKEVSVDIRTDGQGYCGMAEENRVGVSLIFYLQNPAQFVRVCSAKQLPGEPVTTTLTALARSGTILLPKKDSGMPRAEVAYENRQEINGQRERSVRETIFSGDDDRSDLILDDIEDDMDKFAMITRRVVHEDILTIVDSYFMPNGMECDQYQILGTILHWVKVQNITTGEQVVQMTMDCNDMVLDVCINAADLLGEPAEGRRFKGNVWLQGHINFSEKMIPISENI